MLRHIAKPDGNGSLMPDIAAQSEHDSIDAGIFKADNLNRLLDRPIVNRHHEDCFLELGCQFLEQTTTGFDVFVNGGDDDQFVVRKIHVFKNVRK